MANPLDQFLIDPSAYGASAVNGGGGIDPSWLQDWSQIPGMERFGQQLSASEQASSGGLWANNDLMQALAERGYRLYEQPNGSHSVTRGIVDAQGNFVGQPQTFGVDAGNDFMRNALMMAAGAGYGAYTGAGSAGAGADAGWAAGGGYGAGGADVGMAAAGGGGAAASGGAAGAGGGAGGGGAGLGGGAMSNWDWLGGVAEQVIPALIQDRAARGAREDMNAATQAGIAEQRRQFDQTRADLAPYRDAVNWSMPQLQGLIGQPVSPEEVMQDPGYQFGLDQSMRALNQRIAAMGGRVSGNALRGAAEYAGNYATTRYNDAHARRMDRIRALQSMAGLSQNAASQTGQFGAGATNAISGMLGQQGEANAGSRMARGNIWANAGNALMAQYGRRQTTPPPRQGFRYDDPYRNPGYYGGDEGE